MTAAARRGLALAAILALLVAPACTSKPDDGAAGRPIPPPGGGATPPSLPADAQVLPEGGDFTLVGPGGKPFTLASLHGQVVVLFFGYASCPDFCPRAMATVRAALATLEPAQRDRVFTVFISVDPDRDTPAKLERYVGQFGLRAAGVTGTDEQLGELIKRYGADYEKDPSLDSANYTVTHPTSLYIVGPDGKLRAIVSSAGDAAKDLATTLRRAL
jgi:protein SCO1/2